jgi:hypothetical protein
MSEPMTLIPSRIKWWVMIAAAIGFAVVLLVNFAGNTGAMIMAAFCVLFAGLCTIMLLPGSGSLRLDEQGFQVTHFFRVTHYRWSEVSDFGVCNLGQSGGDVVAFKTVEPPRSLWGKVNAALLHEWNAYLPDTYGMTAEDLARFMGSRLAQAKTA